MLHLFRVLLPGSVAARDAAAVVAAAEDLYGAAADVALHL